MEDDLSFLTMEDDLKYLKIEVRKTASISLMEDNINFKKMEDDLNFLENGRRPQFFYNGR